MLQDNPAAKVVMLVPEVVLATQQAATFIKGGVAGAAAFSGANESLNIGNWGIKLTLHSVLVCTPQVLVNVLEKQPGALQQVQLLVLDEVHHTSKDHPYAKVLRTWRQLKDAVGGRGIDWCCHECLCRHNLTSSNPRSCMLLAGVYQIWGASCRELLPERSIVEQQPRNTKPAKQLRNLVAVAQLPCALQ